MTSLRQDINAETDLIPVSAGISSPTYPLFRTIGSETIKVVAGATTTEWSVERGVGDTQAAPHGKGAALVADASPFGSTGGDSGSGALTSVVTNLTAGQIATLSSVPVQVVAAPGAGKVIVPVSAVFQYKAGVAAFDEMTQVKLVIDDIGAMEFEAFAFDATTSQVGIAAANNPLETQPTLANLPLNVWASDDDPGGAGNGTARLQVLYYVMDLA